MQDPLMPPGNAPTTSIKPDDNGAAPVLVTGARVSLELPEAGTCVAVVTSAVGDQVRLQLLDELPPGSLHLGAAFELFVPRPAGIYHWLCALRELEREEEALVQLLSEPLFVQRRRAHRWEASLEAQVRRVHAARRGAIRAMKVADLSRGGLKLEGPVRLSTGDTLEVGFNLGREVELMGRVVMAYPAPGDFWAVHVSFLEGQREAMELLDRYIAKRAEGRRH